MALQPAYRHWTRKEYDRLIELGILREDERIELIGGEMIVAEPKGSPRQTSIVVTAEALRAAFGPGWVVREQGPIALDEESEPEPDVVVVAGRPRDYRAGAPGQARADRRGCRVERCVRPPLQGQSLRSRRAPPLAMPAVAIAVADLLP